MTHSPPSTTRKSHISGQSATYDMIAFFVAADDQLREKNWCGIYFVYTIPQNKHVCVDHNIPDVLLCVHTSPRVLMMKTQDNMFQCTPPFLFVFYEKTLYFL